MKKQYNAAIPMRDGLILRADLYFPEEGACFPTILVRTPYDKTEYTQTPRYTSPELYTASGYAVVVQDCRGTGESEGHYQPWLMDAEDGYDTVEWVAAQEWSNGKVGMMGSSNLGATQLLAASMRPPHLTCICPAGTSAGFPFFKNGVMDLAGTAIWYMQQAVRTSRRAGMEPEALARLTQKMKELSDRVEEQLPCLPLRDIPFAHVEDVQMDRFFLEYLDHIEEVAYWTKLHMPADLRAIEVPTLWIMNWYDHLAKTVLEGYHTMKTACVPSAQDNLYLYFGPWRIYGGVEGSDAGACLPGDPTGQPVWGIGKRLSEILLSWFDFWLKGEDSSFNREQHVLVHTLGEEARWRYEAAWPLPETVFTRFYLSSCKGANTFHGDGRLTKEQPKTELPDSYEYDPKHPAPSKSGLVINPKDSLIQDQTEVEARWDVLVYTTEVLEERMEITGPVTAKLWASTDGPDTDFVVKLVDVHPDGTPYNLTEGIVRARFRNGWDRPELLIPDAVYEYEIDLGGIGIVLGKGHAIRIEIASSNFPKWDRNLNTGHAVGQDAETRIAKQKIYHDAEHPSHVVLPVIPAKTTRQD